MVWCKSYQINKSQGSYHPGHQWIVQHSLTNYPDSFKRVFGFFVFLAQTFKLMNFQTLQTCKLANFGLTTQSHF